MLKYDKITAVACIEKVMTSYALSYSFHYLGYIDLHLSFLRLPNMSPQLHLGLGFLLFPGKIAPQCVVGSGVRIHILKAKHLRKSQDCTAVVQAKEHF